MHAAAPHISVTIYPVVVKRPRNSGMFTPVWLKNSANTFICNKSAAAVSRSTRSVSTARSTTTVPRAFGKDTPSLRLSTPHRVNSPMRGMARLTAYERKMASMLVVARTFSPIGSSVWRQRHPRNICARMPKGIDSHIHVQFISSRMKCSMLWKSKPRYIQ